MSKITVCKRTYEDTMDKIHKGESNIECCGKLIKMVLHMDCRDFYRYTYECECGNIINVDTKRDKSDMWF